MFDVGSDFDDLVILIVEWWYNLMECEADMSRTDWKALPHKLVLRFTV